MGDAVFESKAEAQRMSHVKKNNKRRSANSRATINKSKKAEEITTIREEILVVPFSFDSFFF